MPIRRSDGRVGQADPQFQVSTARRLLAATRERLNLLDKSEYALHLRVDDELITDEDIHDIDVTEDKHARITLKNGKIIVVAAGTLLAAVVGARLFIRHRKNT